MSVIEHYREISDNRLDSDAFPYDTANQYGAPQVEQGERFEDLRGSYAGPETNGSLDEHVQGVSPVASDELPAEFIQTPVPEHTAAPAERYPHDLYFVINQSHMQNGGLIEANDATRLGAMFRALRDACPEYRGLRLEEFRKIEVELKTFSNAEVSIAKVRTPRNTILPYHQAHDILLAELAEANEPLAQLIAQVEKQYPQLPNARELRERLVSGMYADRFKHLYRSVILGVKLQHKKAA